MEKERILKVNPSEGIARAKSLNIFKKKRLIKPRYEDPVENIKDLVSLWITEILDELNVSLNSIAPDHKKKEKNLISELYKSLLEIIEVQRQTEYKISCLVDNDTLNNPNSSIYIITYSVDAGQASDIRGLSKIIKLTNYIVGLLLSTEDAKDKLQTVISTSEERLNAIKNKKEIKVDEDYDAMKEFEKTILSRMPKLKAKEQKYNEIYALLNNFLNSIDKDAQILLEAFSRMAEYALKEEGIYEDETKSKQFIDSLGLADPFKGGLYVPKELQLPPAKTNQTALLRKKKNHKRGKK